METLTLNQAYFIARQYVQSKPIAWDHLEGTNELSSYLVTGMTEAEVYKAADKAYNERLKEDDIKKQSKS